MLGKNDVYATLAVTDLARARQFYEDTLGLEVKKEDPNEVVYRSGSSSISVYVSGVAGTNQATAASWKVGDVDTAVTELRNKGVQFEHYDDMEGVMRQGDIHVMGNVKAAWFKDPDGNILCVSNDAE